MMSDQSKIDYVDATINPLGWGCYGPGGAAEEPKRCNYCYAFRLAKRHLRRCPLCNQFVPHSHSEEWDKPYRWRRGRRIFVQSMGDLFGTGVDPNMSLRLQSLCWATPRHTYLALTKSPARMAEQLAGITLPPNLWLGTSVTCQADADERIPLLLQVPAAVRWVSVEPLLGSVDLEKWLSRDCEDCDGAGFDLETGVCDSCHGEQRWHGIDWVACGAQTGPGAVKPRASRVESIIAQCQDAGIPLFIKSNVAKALGWPEVPPELRRFPEVPNA
jgi:protein gp37